MRPVVSSRLTETNPSSAEANVAKKKKKNIGKKNETDTNTQAHQVK